MRVRKRRPRMVIEITTVLIISIIVLFFYNMYQSEHRQKTAVLPDKEASEQSERLDEDIGKEQTNQQGAEFAEKEGNGRKSEVDEGFAAEDGGAIEGALGTVPVGGNANEQPLAIKGAHAENSCPLFVSKDPKTALPATYVPANLKQVTSPTAIDVKKDPNYHYTKEEEQILRDETMLVAEAADALDDLIAAAMSDGFELIAYSGYRSYETQEKVFKRNVNKLGQKQAERVSAVPGHSEHQTGLVMDITSKSILEAYRIDKSKSALLQVFGTHPEGIWLQENAHKFGFTMSYPEGKEAETGYDYEPWHFRYVGNELAEILYMTKQSFSEYAVGNCD